MPRSLRSRVALLVLLGAFLIPIATSSLRGLTHVLTCTDQNEIPFTVITREGEAPVIASSRSITRGSVEGVCGGLVLALSVGPAGPGRLVLHMPITNNTEFDWHGSVKLRIGPTVVPVGIGGIRAGQTRADTVRLEVGPGQLEVSGSMLIGP